MLWEKSLHSEKEYLDVKKMCLSGRSVFFMCWLVPIRTNTLSNFTEDFFFPTLYHKASSVSSYAERFFENLVYFLIDLLTLPIRVITCIPRAIYNTQKEHALLTYLKSCGINKQLINTDHVRVQITFKCDEGSTFLEEADFSGKKRKVTYQKGELTVQFIDVPNLLFSGGYWSSIFCDSRWEIK